MTRVGVISDTHGLLRPEALEALRDSDLIIHAGDIGPGEIVEGLSDIAETVAIRGNIDRESWAEKFPTSKTIEVSGKRIYILHNLKDLNFDPAAEHVDIVIAGHSHKPSIRQENGVLYLNPGSAGPRRFKLPVAVAKLYLSGEEPDAEIHELVL